MKTKSGNRRGLPQAHPVAGKMLLVFAGICMAVVLAEVALRGLEHYAYLTSANRAITAQLNDIYSDERTKSYVFGHKPNVRVRLERGRFSFTLVTNSDGLRETRDYGHLERSVIFLGDSVVEGPSVENEETMDSVFESLTGVVSLNFGVACYNTAHEYFWLKSKYRPAYNTKLIILGFSLNDFDHSTILRCYEPGIGNWAAYQDLSEEAGTAKDQLLEREAGRKPLLVRMRALGKQSKALTLLYGTYVRAAGLKETKLPFRYQDVSELDKWFVERYICKINDFARQIGSEFIVIIFPLEAQLIVDYHGERRMQDALIEILQRQGIPFIDLYGAIRKQYREHPEVRWYYDESHPYKAGHRLIGEYLAAEIPKRFPSVFSGGFDRPKF